MEKLIPESQLKEAVRQILVEMLLGNQLPQEEWQDTENAYVSLGLCSAERLRNMVREGTLRVGHEVRDIRSRNSQIARYQFNIEKAKARLSLPPERRGKK